MAREVQNERFFHINRQLPYCWHAPLAAGQRIIVGTAENPFFRFFRTNVRAYPVQLPDGSTVQVPAISFLRHVRDGKSRRISWLTMHFK